MVRNSQRLVSPFYRLLNQISHGREAVHLAHLSVAVQLHPFSFGTIHTRLYFCLQLHKACHLHAEFIHHVSIPRHIALHPQHSTQLQLVLELVAGLVGSGKLVLIALQHYLQGHAISFVTNIKGQNYKASPRFMLYKGL